jgi:hypothetical protein
LPGTTTGVERTVVAEGLLGVNGVFARLRHRRDLQEQGW